MDRIRIERIEARYRDGWPRDLMHVRRSAFNRGPGPYPLRRQVCWYVRAVVDRPHRKPKLVGYVVAYPVYDDTASFDEIAVLKEYQGHGVASALTANTVDWLKDNGIQDISGLAIHPAMSHLFRRHNIGGTGGPPTPPLNTG